MPLSPKAFQRLKTDLDHLELLRFLGSYLEQPELDPHNVDLRDGLKKIYNQNPDWLYDKAKKGRTLLDLAFKKNLPLLSELLLELNLIHHGVDTIFSYYQNSDQNQQSTIRNMLVNIFRRNPELINMTNYNGDSLLHIAVRNGFQLLAETLLHTDIQYIGDQGQPLVNLKNHQDQTALEIGLVHEKNECVNLLLLYNASFYMERGSKGEYLRGQYRYQLFLPKLLARGQTIDSSFLDTVISIVKSHQISITDRFEFREYLNRVALRLVGLTGKGSGIDFQSWGELYANKVSQLTKLCTLEQCFEFGEQFGITVNYLVVHVRALLEIVLTQDEAYIRKELIIAINTAKIDQETTLLQLVNNNAVHIQAHVDGLYHRLSNGEPLCYPGGWPGKFPELEGHAIYTDIRRASSVYLNIFNLGSGLEKPYCKPLLRNGGKKCLPLSGSFALTEKHIKNFLQGLVWGNCFGEDLMSIDIALNDTYKEAFFGRPLQTLALEYQAEFCQRIGNCLVINYLFGERTRLGDIPYQQLYLKLLNITLEQGSSYCGLLPEPAAIVSGLKKSQVVFSDITLETITNLSVFKTPLGKCQFAKESKETKEFKGGAGEHKAAVLTPTGARPITLGFLKTASTPFRHRGEQLTYTGQAPKV